MPAGRFVVIEGLDGAGTTTQVERLSAWLTGAGVEVVATREPTGLPIGRLIRSTLRAEADAPARAALPWMFAADRADHLARVVEPALARGAWVVSDRYAPSSLAYQSLDVPLSEVWALNATFRVPDLLIMVELPVEVALGRVLSRGGQREIFEERATLDAVARQYREVITRLEARGDRVARVDGAAGVEVVFDAVRAAVRAAWPEFGA